MKLSVKGCCGCSVAIVGLLIIDGIVMRFAGTEAAKGVLYLLFFIVVWYCVSRKKRRQLLKMSDDDDVMGVASAFTRCAESQCGGSLPVLVDGILVREVAAMASKLESSGIRFSVERSGEDRSLVYGGHGGTGTLMRIRVNPSDFKKAIKILGELGINSPVCHIEPEGDV
jgi:hypothetical protein